MSLFPRGVRRDRDIEESNAAISSIRTRVLVLTAQLQQELQHLEHVLGAGLSKTDEEGDQQEIEAR